MVEEVELLLSPRSRCQQRPTTKQRYLKSSVAMATTQPTNPSELQLYRVLQRANLLQYYETFITQGGDDVQQLCEAGEEEFLEIMALVGMASKPLHVRRLQKSLQEWVSGPTSDLSMFQPPRPLGAALTPPPAPPGSMVASVQGAVAGAMAYAVAHSASSSAVITAPTWNPRPASAASATAAMTPVSMPPGSACTPGTPSPPPSIIAQPTSTLMTSCSLSANNVNINTAAAVAAAMEFVPSPAPSTGMDTPKNSPSPSNRDSSSPTPMPVLSENQIKAISQAAQRVAKSLPPLGPKPMNSKKQLCKEIESGLLQDLVLMPLEHPERMDLLRKYAAIYGRFDSKRKNEKPMSLHEISVNEAAAQLCAHTTALLTRREELFPLARTVVRDSGYQYAKGHSRAQNEGSQEPPTKRCKMSSFGKKSFKSELDKIHQEERLAEIHATLTTISAKQEDLKARLEEVRGHPLEGNGQGHSLEEVDTATGGLQSEMEALTTQQMQLVAEQTEIVQRLANNIRYHVGKKHGQGGISGDDETDSSNLASGGSSPRNGTGDPDDMDFYKVKVKSESKGQLQQTLFDEGLRIAQQYGMSDFAEELKGLKQGSDDSREATENGNNNDPEDKTERDSWSCDGNDTQTNRDISRDLRRDIRDSQKTAYNLTTKSESNSHVAIETS